MRRLRWQQVHPAYAAIVAQAYALDLPHRHACDITIYDQVLIARLRPSQFASLLHESGSLLSIPEPNTRPLDYLFAARRTHSYAIPFWWDGNALRRVERIDDLIGRMDAVCAALRRHTRASTSAWRTARAGAASPTRHSSRRRPMRGAGRDPAMNWTVPAAGCSRRPSASFSLRPSGSRACWQLPGVWRNWLA